LNDYENVQGETAMELLETFCQIDDFCKTYEKSIAPKTIGRKSACRMTTSEVVTIVVMFHQSNYRNFKAYFKQCVAVHYKKEFPKLLSYNRFVEVKAGCLTVLAAYLKHQAIGKKSDVAFVDSTAIAVCHNKRSMRNRVFAGFAKKTKSTMGWYFGFKLHLVVNSCGEILSCCITKSTTDDRKPVPQLVAGLQGKLFGDKGYISKKLTDSLASQGLKLITTVRRNMKNKLLPLAEKLLLRKRFVIETINDQLKNISQIEHTRHRSLTNFLINCLAGLVAYTMAPKKPSIQVPRNALELMASVS
jgi:uncharacterized membrane protein (UPF0136 family)